MKDTIFIRENRRNNASRQYNYKLLKTTALIVLWITTGLFISLAGTTLVDFKTLLGTDFDQLGTVMVLRTVGYMIGCALAGVVHDKVGIQSELIVGLAAALCSLANFLKPYARSIELFGVLNTMEGFGHSCMNTVNNALLLRLWGKQASMPLHIFHFGFGFGAFLGPFLVKDYLSMRCPHVEGVNDTANWYHGLDNFTSHQLDMTTEICQNSTKDHPVILRYGRLEIPFCIVGSLLAVASVVLLTFYLLERCSAQFRLAYKEHPKAIRVDSSALEKTTPKSNCSFIKSFSFRFTVGLFFTYMCINSFEGVIYNYLFTFAYESGTGFSKSEAAYLASAYWGSYTLSRLIASLIAHFVTVKIMIFVETVGTLASLIIMLFWGFHSKVGMWTSVCLLGVFVAPIWPSGVAWADRYIWVKASVVAATDVGAGVGGSICMWIAGHMVNINHTRYYLYVASSGCACAVIFLIALQVIGYRHGDRYARLARRQITVRSK